MSNLFNADDAVRFGAYDTMTRADIFWTYIWPFLKDKDLRVNFWFIHFNIAWAKLEPVLRATLPPSTPTTA